MSGQNNTPSEDQKACAKEIFETLFSATINGSSLLLSDIFKKGPLNTVQFDHRFTRPVYIDEIKDKYSDTTTIAKNPQQFVSDLSQLVLNYRGQYNLTRYVDALNQLVYQSIFKLRFSGFHTLFYHDDVLFPVLDSVNYQVGLLLNKISNNSPINLDPYRNRCSRNQFRTLSRFKELITRRLSESFKRKIKPTTNMEQCTLQWGKFQLSLDDAYTDASISVKRETPMEEITTFNHECILTTYKIGDWVLVKNPYDPTMPTVCQISKLWKNHKGKRFIRAYWFFRPEQTIHRVDRLFLPNEVICSTISHKHALSDIQGHCFVSFFDHYMKGDPILPTNVPKSQVFVCEFRYDSIIRSFYKIYHWESFLPLDVRDKVIPYSKLTGTRSIKKVESPIKDRLPKDATNDMRIPPGRRNRNAPPLIGDVYLRDVDPTDKLGQYSTSIEFPSYIIRPGDNILDVNTCTNLKSIQSIDEILRHPFSSRKVSDKEPETVNVLYELHKLMESVQDLKLTSLELSVMVDFIEWQLLHLKKKSLELDYLSAMRYIYEVVVCNVTRCSSLHGEGKIEDARESLITVQIIKDVLEALATAYVSLGATESLNLKLLEIKLQRLLLELDSIVYNQFATIKDNLVHIKEILFTDYDDGEFHDVSEYSSAYEDAEGDEIIIIRHYKSPEKIVIDHDTDIHDTQSAEVPSLQVEENDEEEMEVEDKTLEQIPEEETTNSNQTVNEPIEEESIEKEEPIEKEESNKKEESIDQEMSDNHTSNDSIDNGTYGQNDTASRLQDSPEDLPPASNETDSRMLNSGEDFPLDSNLDNIQRKPQEFQEDLLPEPSQEHYLKDTVSQLRWPESFPGFLENDMITSTQIPLSKANERQELSQQQDGDDTENFASGGLSQVFSTAPSQPLMVDDESLDEEMNDAQDIQPLKLNDSTADKERVDKGADDGEENDQKDKEGGRDEKLEDALSDKEETHDNDMDHSTNSTQQMPPPRLPQTQQSPPSTQVHAIKTHQMVQVPGTPSPHANNIIHYGKRFISLDNTHDQTILEDESIVNSQEPKGNNKDKHDNGAEEDEAEEEGGHLITSSPPGTPTRMEEGVEKNIQRITVSFNKEQEDIINKKISAIEKALNRNTEYSSETAKNVAQLFKGCKELSELSSTHTPLLAFEELRNSVIVVQNRLSFLDSHCVTDEQLTKEMEKVTRNLQNSLITYQKQQSQIRDENSETLSELKERVVRLQSKLDLASTTSKEDFATQVKNCVLEALPDSQGDIEQEMTNFRKDRESTNHDLVELKKKLETLEEKIVQQKFTDPDNLNKILRKNLANVVKIKERVDKVEQALQRKADFLTVEDIQFQIRKLKDSDQTEDVLSKTTSLQQQLDSNHGKAIEMVTDLKKSNITLSMDQHKLSLKITTLTDNLTKISDFNKKLANDNMTLREELKKRDEELKKKQEQLKKRDEELRKRDLEVEERMNILESMFKEYERQKSPRHPQKFPPPPQTPQRGTQQRILSPRQQETTASSPGGASTNKNSITAPVPRQVSTTSPVTPRPFTVRSSTKTNNVTSSTQFPRIFGSATSSGRPITSKTPPFFPNFTQVDPNPSRRQSPSMTANRAQRSMSVAESIISPESGRSLNIKLIPITGLPPLPIRKPSQSAQSNETTVAISLTQEEENSVQPGESIASSSEDQRGSSIVDQVSRINRDTTEKQIQDEGEDSQQVDLEKESVQLSQSTQSEPDFPSTSESEDEDQQDEDYQPRRTSIKRRMNQDNSQPKKKAKRSTDVDRMVSPDGDKHNPVLLD